ncbi:MAG TPA: hypothetical protein VF115_07180 [Acidimicrobiia bacterium]
MSRWTGWVILVVAGALIYSAAFTTYEAWTGSWRSTESGGLVRVNVECPSPFQVLVLGAEPDREEDEGLCEPSARTLAVEASVVALAAILLAWAAVTRPRPARLEPLSSKLSLGEEESPDWGREETPADSGRADLHH